MTFQDIFKSDFLSNVSSFSVLDAVLALGMAFVIGLFIYAVYKKTFGGVMYSKTFNVSLVALCMLTTFVILAVTSNVVLSLGMVGALSIVRFRTAIKDPMDIVFLLEHRRRHCAGRGAHSCSRLRFPCRGRHPGRLFKQSGRRGPYISHGGVRRPSK